MKTLIQILVVTIALISCADKPSEITHNQNKKEFEPDPSYVEYWCSLNVLKKTETNLNKLDLATVAEFLASFNRDCADNAEFSEWSNELLFEVAKNKPDFLLQLLDKNSSLDKDLIRAEFENPVHDSADIAEIIEKIEKSNSPKTIKEEILESLKVAKSKFE